MAMRQGHHAPSTSSQSSATDLRAALTVRNTFIEFDEAGVEDALREGLWGRQASEPAKLCGRQVSDQTTSASGGAGPGGSDQEDSSQIAQYLASSAFRSQAAALGNFESQLLGDAGKSVLQEVPAAPAAAHTMRFCPNCGTEAEPTHRFCPFCRYQLQPSAPAPGSNGGYTMPAPAPASQASPAPLGLDLISNVRRFRYVEASQADIRLAQVTCLNFQQPGVAH
mmetsp:Transcript_6529/g.17723  ORF Transcript_6529/g.17723 Transcript_6529/m.17723 type:complete len:224 (-) Transcript_6529:288-959(-)